MAKPKKGVIPPHLKKFLFKKGRKKKSVRRRSRRLDMQAALNRAGRGKKGVSKRFARAAVLARRAKNPSGYAASHRNALLRRLRAARRARPAPKRQLLTIITATKGGKCLSFDGAHFSNKHAPRKFPSISAADQKARELIRKFPILRSYAIHVRYA